MRTGPWGLLGAQASGGHGGEGTRSRGARHPHAVHTRAAAGAPSTWHRPQTHRALPTHHACAHPAPCTHTARAHTPHLAPSSTRSTLHAHAEQAASPAHARWHCLYSKPHGHAVLRAPCTRTQSPQHLTSTEYNLWTHTEHTQHLPSSDRCMVSSLHPYTHARSTSCTRVCTAPVHGYVPAPSCSPARSPLHTHCTRALGSRGSPALLIPPGGSR